MRAILLTVIFFAFIGYALVRPWAAILIWSWMSYMNPHRFAFGFAYTFPYSAIAAGVTVVGCFISKERRRFPVSRETVLLILFCFWITFTTFFAFNAFAWDYWARAVKVQAMIFMTLYVMRTRFHLDALVWTIVVSIGFYGVKGAIWSLLTGGVNRVQGPEATFISDNNTIALALVMVLPLMRYLQLQSTHKWISRGLAVAIVLTALAALMTYSRGGLVALSVVGLLLWLKSRHKLGLVLAAALLVGPLIAFLPDQWKDRMRTIQTTDENQLDSSAVGRLNVWALAWNLAVDRPLTGGGFRVFFLPAIFDRYAPDPRDRHDSHSIYFGILGEHGFPGLAIFLALGVSTWLTARKVARRVRGVPQLEWASDLVRMVQVSLGGYAAGGAFVGLAYFDLPYHLIAVVVICNVITKQERAEIASSAYEMDSAQVPATPALIS